MKDVDCVGVVDQIHTFAHILHRHAVVMLVQSDIAVTLNRCDSPLLHLIAACRQWTQGVLFDSLKELAAGFPTAGQIAGIELLQRLEDGSVGRLQIIEHQTFKVYVHGPVHQFYRILHQSLVLGMAHAGRDYGAAVMLGKGFEVRIDHRLIAVAASDCGFQVVRYYRTGSPSIKVESILARLYKILLLLRSHGLTVSVMTAWQYRHKHLNLSHLGSRLIDYLQTVTGKIDIHLVSGAMLDIAYGIGLQHELSELHPERCPEVSVGMSGMILLIQFPDSHAPARKPCCIFRQQCFKPDLTI